MTDDFSLMQQGICPVCRMTRDEHSERKAKICLGIMRQRHGVKPTRVEIDGKPYNVTARRPTKEEMQAAKESEQN